MTDTIDLLGHFHLAEILTECEDCECVTPSLMRCDDDTTWPVCSRMVCSDCAAKSNHIEVE